MEPSVSVIVPVYKVQDYLDRCVESLLGQSFRDFELILVDDGSPDNCGALCDQYAANDPRVRVIHKPNGGLSDARNAGLEIATGELLTFVDSDDWVHPDYLQILKHNLETAEACVSCCGFHTTSTVDFATPAWEGALQQFSNLEALNQLFGPLSVVMVVAWGKLYKRHLFDGIRFPVGKLHEDEFTTYKLLHAAHRVVLDPRPLLFYWQRPDSITGVGFNPRGRVHALQAWLERARFLDTVEDPALATMAYKSLFSLALQVWDQRRQFANPADREFIMDCLKIALARLRHSEVSPAFHALAALSRVSPTLASRCRQFVLLARSRLAGNRNGPAL